MAFTEKIKYEVKKLSHQCCCVCKNVGIEIHHIKPQAENGEDTIENAAPLCPSCHEIYGQNPTKRKFITESRDIWYEICSKRYSFDSSQLTELLSKVNNIEKSIGKLSYSISDNKSKLLSFGALIDFFNKFKTPTDSKEYNNFKTSYLLIFGTKGSESEEDQGFNFIRDYFLETFGKHISERVILYLIDELKIDWNNGVSEDVLDNFIAHFQFMVHAIFMNYDLGINDEKIGIKINEDGELTYYAIK